MTGLKISSGSTLPGSTNWQQNPGGLGVFVDIDTSAAGFTTTPLYLTSIVGGERQWETTGATSIYLPTPTSFRIFVRWVSNESLTPIMANNNKWHINWLGIQS